MLDGQGCLLPVRHFHSEDSPVMISSLSGRYPTCRAEAVAETNPNSSANPQAHHSQEFCSWSLVQESNPCELLDLSISRSCNSSPVPFEEADTTQASDNNVVLVKEGTRSSTPSDFDCLSTSPSRSALAFPPPSPAQEVEAAPAQSRSSNGELEGVVTSHCVFAEADSRSADFSRSVQEEGSSSKALCGNEMHMEFAEAASSSVVSKKEGLNRSVGDGSESRRGIIALCNCGQDCSDGTERSTGFVHPGTPQNVSSDKESQRQLLGSVCSSKDSINSEEMEEDCLETVNAERIHIEHGSFELLAGHGLSAPCQGGKGCKKMRLSIQTSSDTLAGGTSISAPEEMAHSPAERTVNTYFPGLMDDAALRCLAFVALSDLGRLSRVATPFRDLVKSRLILKLRQMYGMVEHLVFTYASGPSNWTAYDVNRNVWTTLPPANEDSVFLGSDKESLSAGTQVLWFGNRLFDFVYYRYDLVTNSWDMGPPMINPRCLFASASFGDFAYVAGGFGPANDSGALTILSSAEKYDSLTGQWEALPPMSTPRQKCAGFFMDGKFHVIGGRDANHQPIMSGEEYNPVTGAWRTIPDMYFAPAVHRRDMVNPPPPLVAVVNNQLYAVETTTNALKIYNKQINTWTNLGYLPVPADFRNGWGIAFKGLGDTLFVLGDRQGIAAFGWRPGPSVAVPNWQLLSHRARGVNSFLYNCAVMTC
ncbi:hypothetical protein GOP47_0019349 [Adiantum capillus-veneris]|uniref:Kelch repeat-containing protein n=1 Tax=Adiantum capillus-veneris TaxID=13818 RepID=A0A9D4UF33_ADICA|nr:hypothetical protein GOP47_0019349 [Adiantum capillus-veneris]